MSIRLSTVQDQLYRRYLDKSSCTASDLFSTFANMMKVGIWVAILLLTLQSSNRDTTEVLHSCSDLQLYYKFKPLLRISNVVDFIFKYQILLYLVSKFEKVT